VETGLPQENAQTINARILIAKPVTTFAEYARAAMLPSRHTPIQSMLRRPAASASCHRLCDVGQDREAKQQRLLDNHR
jgi:hypothetical protein